MDIKSVFNSSFDRIETICVAIGRPDKNRNQQHIGFLFIDEDATVKFLHLAWHCNLIKESPDNHYIWLDVPLDPFNKIHLATVCASIFKANQEGRAIPYGICIDGTGFSKEGLFVSKEQYAGLTCATFVIQVFHSQDYPIIDFKKWVYREEDKTWQTMILQLLKKYVDIDYLNAQYAKLDQGVYRFKPEEVAAAAALPNAPHGFETLKEPAEKILNSVIEHTNCINHQ